MLLLSSSSRVRQQRNNGRLRNKKKSSKSVASLPSINVTTFVVALFVSLWCIVAFHVHASIGSLEQQQSGGGYENIRKKEVTITTNNNYNYNIENPWEGWQPLIIDKNDKENPPQCASWRICFTNDHKCGKFCRDDAQEFYSSHVPEPPQNWIPDVTMLRRMMQRGQDSNGNPWPPPLDRELCNTMGFDGGTTDDSNGRLIQQAPILAKPLVMKDDEHQKGPKIMCMIYTMQDAHATRIRAIRETWAGGCDGFLAFSTQSDPRIPAISISHEGKEDYSNMWQKIRSMWKFVASHYLHEFDFFFIGGDDLYVLPQNLRHYLGSLEGSPHDTPHFVGRRFKGSSYFYSGGAGYSLSQKALRQFMTVVDEPKCFAHAKTPMEDVIIAKCLLQELGLKFQDTRDDQGRERFHPFAPGHHLTWKPPKKGDYDWYEDYNEEWGVKLGTECCAPDSVSFHYIKKQATVRHVHALLYMCPPK